MRRAAALLAVALLAGGCGGDEGSAGELDGLTVYAAASLTEAFRELAPGVRFNFAGSDELATQIREGAPADVYAAASPRYPAELVDEGLLERPRIFATNRLVIVVPGDNPAGIASADDLRATGVRLVLGGEGVPVGDYARAVLDRLGAAEALDNVVSNEDDVKGVLGKVAAGDADAGFVYATDARAAGGDVAAIELPARARAEIRYPIAVVSDSERRGAAERFVGAVLGARGRRALAAAGFGLP